MAGEDWSGEDWSGAYARQCINLHACWQAEITDVGRSTILIILQVLPNPPSRIHSQDVFRYHARRR